MNRSSLLTRRFRRIHFSVFRYRLSKNGFTGPKRFRGFRETGPRGLVVELAHVLVFCFRFEWSVYPCVCALRARTREKASDPRNVRACTCTRFSRPNSLLVSFQIKQISEAWKYHALRKSPKHSVSVPRPRPRRGTKPREMYTEVS